MTASHQCVHFYDRMARCFGTSANNGDHASSILEKFDKGSKTLPISEFHPKLYIRSSLTLFIELTNPYNSGSQHMVPDELGTH